MAGSDHEDVQSPFRNSPTGPWVPPPRASASPPPAAPPAAIIRTRRPIRSVVLFAILLLSVGVRAYRDISRPEAWDYWKESYFSPSMTSSLIANASLDAGDRSRRALAIHGTIGAASATWLREQLDEARLTAGDIVLLSSPGGSLDRALIMGEIIRARGLATRSQPLTVPAGFGDPTVPALASSSMRAARPAMASRARSLASIGLRIPSPAAIPSPMRSESPEGS